MDEKSFVVPPDPRIGTVVRERYRIVRLLGEGGMGAVYEAEHVLIRRRCAIKFLHAQYARSPAALTRFRREALAAAAVGNSHIVEVTDMDQADDGSPFIVLEYLEGLSVADDLERKGPMPLARALHVLRQLCEALAAVHEKGIVHRDLKPENLFLVRNGQDPDFLKVLDFGISKFTESDDGLTVNLTKTGAAVGSVYFMSPEQARAAQDLDGRADIYAVGGVFYFLLTGQPLFSGDSLTHMLMQIVSDPPPPVRLLRPDVPPGLERCLLRMLEKDRTLRYPDCNSLWQAVAPYALTAESVAAAGPLLHQISPYSGSTTPMTPLPVSIEPPPPSPSELALPLSTASRQVNKLSRTLPWLLAAGLLGAAVVRGRQALQDPPASALRAEPAERAKASPSRDLPAATQTVRASMRTLPADAALTVNGKTVANPYIATLARSSIAQRVEATHPGYDPQVQEFTLERDVDLTLELTPSHAPVALTAPVAATTRSKRRLEHASKHEHATGAEEPLAAVPAPVAETQPAAVTPAAVTPTAAERAAANEKPSERDIKRLRF